MAFHRWRLAAPLAVALAVAACVGATPLASPAASEGAPGATKTGGASETRAPVTSPAAQAVTPWGRIWEGLPRAFPRPARSEPTEVGGRSPTSATLDVPTSAGTAGDVASFYRSALGSAGYSVSVDGPLENGGYTVSASGSAGCAAQVSVTPLGSSITVTILYGAACPFD